jgi:hypothetical protein
MQDALTYDCSCIGGNTPNISNYAQTLPSLECSEWKGQCTSAHPNDLAGQTFCQSFVCGSLIASAQAASSSSSASKASSSSSAQTTSSNSKAATTTPGSAIETTTKSLTSATFVTITSGSSSSPTHSSLPLWTGNGNLLQGYCSAPQYTLLLAGPVAVIWAPVVGCNDEKPDCCPYSINNPGRSTATATTIVQTTVSVVVGPSGTTTITSNSGPLGFPVAPLASQAVLIKCPADYQSVSGGCCPS